MWCFESIPLIWHFDWLDFFGFFSKHNAVFIINHFHFTNLDYYYFLVLQPGIHHRIILSQEILLFYTEIFHLLCFFSFSIFFFEINSFIFSIGPLLWFRLGSSFVVIHFDWLDFFGFFSKHNAVFIINHFHFTNLDYYYFLVLQPGIHHRIILSQEILLFYTEIFHLLCFFSFSIFFFEINSFIFSMFFS